MISPKTDIAREVGRFEWEKRLRADSALDSTAKLVGYALATWATSENGADARPGSRLLMTATGKSESTVWRALRRLRTAGWLHIANEDERGRRRDLAHEYQLVVPTAPTGTGSSRHPRPVGTGASDQWAPVQSPVGTHAHPQAQDSNRHRSSSTLGEPEELTVEQAGAARLIASRLAPEVSPADAEDCVRSLASRRKPPNSFAAVTRTFDAPTVLENAERHRKVARAAVLSGTVATTRARLLACPSCDEAGWVLDEDPVVRCDHRTMLELDLAGGRP